MSEPLKVYIKNFGGPFQGEEDFKECYLAAEIDPLLTALQQQLEAQAWTVSPAMAQAQIDQLTQGQQRLINSNEHWHVRVEQMIREVEQVTQERDAAEMRELELQRNAILLINKIEALRQQLAAMTQEWDEAVKVVTMLMETGQIMEDDIKWAEAFLLAKQHQGGLP